MKKFALIMLAVFTMMITATVAFAQKPAGNKYVVTVLDDHAVQLVCGTDTLILSLENSARLAEEEVIFVAKPTKSSSVKTEKSFTDTKGVKYPVWKSINGKYFYWKTSSKTGTQYKVYLSQM
jgi:tRNA splicing endonuclease